MVAAHAPAVGARAADLLMVGAQLARAPAGAAHHGALLDVWVYHVMPHAISRDEPDRCLHTSRRIAARTSCQAEERGERADGDDEVMAG